MNFLAPAMFWFALVLPGIVLLYLLKLKRKEIMVSSLLLWRKSIDDMKANAPFQRLRNNLLLWLQLLIIALVIMALVRPVLKVAGLHGQERILLVDTSASMKATDVKPNRMERAKAAANKAIDDLSRGDSMMIITFGGKASVRATLTTDKGMLRRAVAGLSATDETTHIRDALAIAASVARASPNAEVLILSDGQIADLADVPDVPSRVTFAPIGNSGRNIGVARFDVKKSFGEHARYSAFAKVRNFGAQPVKTLLKLTNNDILIDAKEVALEPGKAAAAAFENLRLNQGTVAVELGVADALAADNRAACVLSPYRHTEVLLISKGNYFLEKALRLERQVSLTKAGPAQYSSPEGYDVVIFDGWAPAELPDGHYMFIGVAPPVDGFAADGKVDAPLVLDWDRTHPLARFLTFSGMNVAKALRLSLSKGAKALVESKDAPLIASLARGDKRVVAVSFDVYESDWPLRVSFPLFVSNAVHWLAGRRMGVAAEQYRTGEAIVIPPSKSATTAKLTTPDGRVHAVALDPVKASYFSQTDQAGVYRLDIDDEAHTSLPIAVNLLSEAESQIAPAAQVEIGSRRVVAAPEGVRTNQEVWRWFAALAIVALLVEWHFYTRRAWL